MNDTTDNNTEAAPAPPSQEFRNMVAGSPIVAVVAAFLVGLVVSRFLL